MLGRTTCSGLMSYKGKMGGRGTFSTVAPGVKPDPLEVRGHSVDLPVAPDKPPGGMYKGKGGPKAVWSEERDR